MDPKAIESAKARLRRAEKAVGDLKTAENFEEAEDAWTDFLLAANGIYSKLEQGAKCNGRSISWFGRKKNQRKSDPTLRYIRFARNSEEHGIKRSTSNYPGTLHGMNVTTELRFGERRSTTISKVDQYTGNATGDTFKALLFGECILCVRAYDERFGDYCDPPKFREPDIYRLNGPIMPHDQFHDAEFPDLIAESALPLLQAVIEEAEALV